MYVNVLLSPPTRCQCELKALFLITLRHRESAMPDLFSLLANARTRTHARQWVENYLREHGLADKVKLLRVYNMSWARGAAHHSCNLAPVRSLRLCCRVPPTLFSPFLPLSASRHYLQSFFISGCPGGLHLRLISFRTLFCLPRLYRVFR